MYPNDPEHGKDKMKRAFCSVMVLNCIIFCLISCQSPTPNTITQVSTIDAILAGAYDGQMPCRHLLSYGDFGIGTFDHLDGEMILLDGNCFQVKADGKVYTPAMTMTTPFASVVPFKKDMTLTLDKGLDFQELEGVVNKAVPNMNIFCAVKATGRFLKVTTRSVPAQKKPYPPLVEVTKHQPVFNLKSLSGTIVGFRSPSFVKGVNVPGFHLHFISDDLKSGGHVLEFTLEEGVMEIDVCNRLLLILPEGESAFSQIDLSRDRTSDLEEAERK